MKLTIEQLAEIVQLPVKVILTICKNNSISPIHDLDTGDLYFDESEVIYFTKQTGGLQGLIESAKNLNISLASLKTAIDKAKIQCHSFNGKPHLSSNQIDQLKDLFKPTNHYTLSEICKKLNVEYKVLYDLIKRNKIQVSYSVIGKPLIAKNEILVIQELITNQAFNKGLPAEVYSISQFAKLVKCSIVTLNARIRRKNITPYYTESGKAYFTSDHLKEPVFTFFPRGVKARVQDGVIPFGTFSEDSFIKQLGISKITYRNYYSSRLDTNYSDDKTRYFTQEQLDFARRKVPLNTYSIRELQNYSGLTRMTITKLVKNGVLTQNKSIFNRAYFSLDDVQKIIPKKRARQVDKISKFEVNKSRYTLVEFAKLINVTTIVIKYWEDIQIFVPEYIKKHFTVKKYTDIDLSYVQNHIINNPKFIKQLHSISDVAKNERIPFKFIKEQIEQGVIMPISCKGNTHKYFSSEQVNTLSSLLAKFRYGRDNPSGIYTPKQFRKVLGIRTEKLEMLIRKKFIEPLFMFNQKAYFTDKDIETYKSKVPENSISREEFAEQLNVSKEAIADYCTKFNIPGRRSWSGLVYYTTEDVELLNNHLAHKNNTKGLLSLDFITKRYLVDEQRVKQIIAEHKVEHEIKLVDNQKYYTSNILQLIKKSLSVEQRKIAQLERQKLAESSKVATKKKIQYQYVKDKNLMSLIEIADNLSETRAKIDFYIKSRKLKPVYKIGKVNYYNHDSFNIIKEIIIAIEQNYTIEDMVKILGVYSRKIKKILDMHLIKPVILAKKPYSEQHFQIVKRYIDQENELKENYYTLTQIAELSGKLEDTVYSYFTRRPTQFPFIKNDKTYYYRKSDVAKYLESILPAQSYLQQPFAVKCAELCSISLTNVRKYIKKLNIQPNYTQLGTRYYTENQIHEFASKFKSYKSSPQKKYIKSPEIPDDGFTLSLLARKFNRGFKTVEYWVKKFNIHPLETNSGHKYWTYKQFLVLEKLVTNPRGSLPENAYTLAEFAKLCKIQLFKIREYITNRQITPRYTEYGEKYFLPEDVKITIEKLSGV